MTGIKSVYEAFQAVMDGIRAIEKNDRNSQQGFQFRGIDAVMQAVGPVLREHNVVIVPNLEELSSESYQTRSGASMRNVTVKVRYRVYGPGGDYFDGTTAGEAADAGDKAVTKAQSVAYRTFLLQALTVPTGDVDPDAVSHERAAGRPKSPADAARDDLLALCRRHKLSPQKIGARFHDEYQQDLNTATDADLIRGFAQVLADEAKIDEAADD